MSQFEFNFRFTVLRRERTCLEGFDSLGFPEDILTCIKEHFNLPIIHNQSPYQPLNSDLCGLYAIYYAYRRIGDLGRNPVYTQYLHN